MENHAYLSQFITEDIYLINQTDQRATSPDEGPNSKTYLIVTEQPLSSIDQEFLHRIFSAVDVSPDMMELGNSETEIHDGHSKIFFFGTEPVSESVELYQEFSFQNCTAIVTHSLSEIAADTTKKKALWSVLKSCFP